MESPGQSRWLQRVRRINISEPRCLTTCPLSSFKDKVRGVQNEGGLYGEREGWHLPDFDDSDWSKADLSNGLPENQAGVGWFRTTFSLDIPVGYDVPLSFEFETENAPYRALLFVNGCVGS